MKVDLGKADKIEKNLMPIRAMDKERHTWEESFFSYSQRHKTEIDERMINAKTWQDVHAITLEYGIEVKPHGAGLGLKNINGTESVKASSLGRNYTKKQLETKFGSYEPPLAKVIALAKDHTPKNDIATPKPVVEPIIQAPSQTVESYVESQKKFIELDIAKNTTWQSVHEATREYGLELATKGAGVVIKSLASGETVKASFVAREFSLKNLEGKFGPFQQYETPIKVLTKLQKNKDTLSIDIKHSTNWDTLHKRLDHQGFAIRKFKRGYFLQDKSSPTSFIHVSNVDKGLTTKSINEKLGLFKSPKLLPDQTKKRYAPKPLFKHPRLPAAWKRYIGAKKATPSLAARAYTSWRQFLMADALNDPMAMAIIHMQNKIISDLFGPSKKSLAKSNSLSPQNHLKF